jgi:hypothetical protein
MVVNIGSVDRIAKCMVEEEQQLEPARRFLARDFIRPLSQASRLVPSPRDFFHLPSFPSFCVVSRSG